jgi:hypothetical protein
MSGEDTNMGPEFIRAFIEDLMEARRMFREEATTDASRRAELNQRQLRFKVGANMLYARRKGYK